MKLRNIAIIAHVDHGKTTLIDVLLKESGAFRENQRIEERALDSNDLERERGITILAKVTSLVWNDTRINIVDTPGHADFGGEVERILHMVDGVILLVDASEGPMPQTKFVLSKALKLGLKPIVAINKFDKPDQRANEVLNDVFDLFANLDATDEQLDFPVLFGSAKQGWMSDDAEIPTKFSMAPLFEKVIEKVAEPKAEDGNFKLLATVIESDPFLGRVLTGRIVSGTVEPNLPLKALNVDGKTVETGRVSKVLAFRGLERQPISVGEAGDIVSIAGLSKASVADTICAVDITTPIPAQPIDPPTLSMAFKVNDGPMAGKEGSKVQSRVIRERLLAEAEGNVALKVEETSSADTFVVSGRGELMLSILIENMRREGFELCVGRPQVVFKFDDNGNKLEPIEEVTIDVDDEFSGTVVKKLAERKAELIEMKPSGGNRTRLQFYAPTRGLIGYQSELMSDTRGTGIFNRIFHEYTAFKGEILSRHTGVLLSNSAGEAVAYALFNLEDRGPIMIEPGTKVYQGMIVGEHTRGNDLEVNVLKGKQLTNMRAAGKDDAVKLTTPMKLSLEGALSYITDDELVEVTPNNIRLRKTVLDPNERKKFERTRKSAA